MKLCQPVWTSIPPANSIGAPTFPGLGVWPATAANETKKSQENSTIGDTEVAENQLPNLSNELEKTISNAKQKAKSMAKYCPDGVNIRFQRVRTKGPMDDNIPNPDDMQVMC